MPNTVTNVRIRLYNVWTKSNSLPYDRKPLVQPDIHTHMKYSTVVCTQLTILAIKMLNAKDKWL